MRQIWTDDENCHIDGTVFKVGKADFHLLKTNKDIVFSLKGKTFFDKYDRYFGNIQPKAVLEVGIFEGGSAILLADKWSTAKIVGIDIRDQNPDVFGHLKKLGFEDRVSLHYNVSQDDSKKITNIIQEQFKSPIDIVIDDCSHLYGLSKKTFETVFPYLVPGGYYVVEDWGWAHWRDWQDRKDWADQPALTNLMFEIIMMAASSSWLVSDVYVNSNFFAVKKSINCPDLDKSFSLDKSYLLRGKKFCLI